MDQDETWRAGRPRPWLHCVRWGPSSPPLKRHSPQFPAHICCGQMAGWIKMPLGREVALGPSDIVLDGDPAPPPQKGTEPPNFWPMSIVAKLLDGSRWHLACRYASARPHCARWELSSPSQKKGHSTQFLAYVCCGRMAGWIKMPLDIMEVGFGPGHIVLGGDPGPPKRGTALNFRLISVVVKRLDRPRCCLVRR